MTSAFRKEEDEVDVNDDWDVELIGARFLDNADREADGEVEDEIAGGGVGVAAAEVDGAHA